MEMPENPYGQKDYFAYEFFNKVQKEDLRWFVEWGEENCPHREQNGWHLKHYCPKCWQELEQKLAELEGKK